MRANDRIEQRAGGREEREGGREGGREKEVCLHSAMASSHWGSRERAREREREHERQRRTNDLIGEILWSIRRCQCRRVLLAKQLARVRKRKMRLYHRCVAKVTLPVIHTGRAVVIYIYVY